MQDSTTILQETSKQEKNQNHYLTNNPPPLITSQARHRTDPQLHDLPPNSCPLCVTRTMNPQVEAFVGLRLLQ